MEITIANPQKGRLESIYIEFTDENTTWFEDCEKDDEVYMITDFEGCLLISQFGYYCPVLIYDESRTGICYDNNKAIELIGLQV